MAVDTDLTRVGVSQAEDRLGQLTLPVTRYAGNAKNFASPHREREIVDRNRSPVAGDREVGDLEPCLTVRLRRNVALQRHQTTDHQLSERFAGRVGRHGPPRHFAIA